MEQTLHITLGSTVGDLRSLAGSWVREITEADRRRRRARAVRALVEAAERRDRAAEALASAVEAVRTCKQQLANIDAE